MYKHSLETEIPYLNQVVSSEFFLQIVTIITCISNP